MKRYVYDFDKSLFVDEYLRLWHLDHSGSCRKWTNVGSLRCLPQDFKYIEY